MLRLLRRSYTLRDMKCIDQHLRFSSTTSSKGRLDGKVALITGGANGIGMATAEEFIRQGASVFIADIDAKYGPQVAQDLGSKAHFIRCDVGVEAQVAQAVDTAVAHHGKLDIMYNNAGIVGQQYPPSIMDLDLEQFDQLMQVNVRGMIVGIKHAARVMVPMGSGSILCTASVCGVLAGLGPLSYTISKFAIPGIVKSVASELAKHGLRINCISPGPIATPMVFDQFRPLYQKESKEQLKDIIGGLGGLKGAKCEEIDVAKAALYLASDDAKYVTGHNLVVDGGLTSYKNIDFPPPIQSV